MEYHCANKDTKDDGIEVMLHINDHDPRNWSKVQYNRYDSWSDSHENFNNIEFDSFSGSESGSQEFDSSKSIEQEKTQVRRSVRYC